MGSGSEGSGVESWGVVAFDAGLGLLAGPHWVACSSRRALVEVEEHEKPKYSKEDPRRISINTTHYDRHEDTIFTKRS